MELDSFFQSSFFAHAQQGFLWQPYLIAIVSALIGLFGRWMYDYYFNLSNLIFDKSVLGPVNQSGIDYYRMLLTNTGRGRARNVEAVVSKVATDDKARQNYLPSPLRWTHQPNPVTVRNIQKNQPVYLDLVEFKQEGNKHILRLLSPQIMDLENLALLSKGRSEISLDLYQSSGQVVSVKVELSWDGKNPPTDFQVY